MSRVRDIYNDTYPVESVKEIAYGRQEFMSLGEYTKWDGRYDTLCAKFEGFFRPPYSGTFRLMIVGDDQSEFLVSRSGNRMDDLVFESLLYFLSDLFCIKFFPV